MIDLQVKINVKKRDGRIVNFDQAKITRAITKAAVAVDGTLAPTDYTDIEHISDDAVATITERFKQDVRIAEVQSIVEEAILNAHRYDWAKAYTDYRLQQDILRAKKTDVNYNVQKLLDRDSSVVHENANKDSRVFSTQRDLTAGAVAKAVGLQMLPPAVANAHMRGDIHWHDLDYTPFMAETNCCLIDFKEMLNHGFVIGNAKWSRPIRFK